MAAIRIEGKARMKRAIVYYSNNKAGGNVIDYALSRLQKSAGDIPIYHVTHKPINYDNNIVVGDMKQKELSDQLFNITYQMLLGCLAAENAEFIYFCEHDVLYPSSYFTFTPDIPDNKNVVYYNSRIIYMNSRGFYKRRFTCFMGPCSQMSGWRNPLIQILSKRLLDHKIGKQIKHTEISKVPEWNKIRWKSNDHTLDIYHGQNVTPEKTRRIDGEYFHKCNWGEHKSLSKELALYE